MARKNIHVAKHPKGGWGTKPEGRKQPTSRHRTQSAAEERAKRDSAKAGGGEVVIHGRDGRFRDKDTVKPARDPFPPRDKRH